MKKLLTILLLFYSVHIYGAEYIVSPSGNDSNAGTLSNPVKTIAKGMSKLKSGDILYIRAGIYNEVITIYNLANVTVSSYNDEIVIIEGTGIDAGEGNGLVRVFSQNTKIIGLTVRNSNQYGITLDQNNAAYSLVSNCTIYNCMESGIGVWNSYCTVENCTVYNASLNNTNGVMPIGWSSGISCHGSSSVHLTGCIVRHSIIHDVWGEGIIIAWGVDCTVEDNTLYDCFSASIYNRNSQNTINQRNLIYTTKVMNKGSQVGIGHWNEEDYAFVNKNNKFLNNIVFNCRNNFANYRGSEGLQVINNTFVNGTASACVVLDDRSEMVNCLFVNNIIVQDNSLQLIETGSGPGLVFQNNLYNKSHSSNFTGTGDIIADPLFMKSGTGAEYYRLQSNSPAINKGLNLVATDYFNNLRVNPDIGAIEYMTATKIETIKENLLKVLLVNSELQIYPDEPAGNILIYNSLGQLVIYKAADSDIIRLNISDLPKGLYIVRYQNRLIVKTIKIIL